MLRAEEQGFAHSFSKYNHALCDGRTLQRMIMNPGGEGGGNSARQLVTRLSAQYETATHE